MTDPISTSKTARESLARGLNALQADPSVPPQLVELAAPIAQAMGALHQIERTRELAPHADVALGHVRGALAKLQAAPTTHPAVNQALEAVATSLSLVHQLSRMAAPAQAPVAAAPAPMAAPPPAQPQPQAPPAHAGTASMHQRGPAPTNHQQPAFPPPQAAHPQQPPMQPPAQQPSMIARDPFASPPPAQDQAPPQHQPPPGNAYGGPAGAQQAPQGKPATPSMPVPAPPAGNLQVLNADLGTHSPTNFYKGLAGNDIIDHGGLFVSTYVSPKIGTPIRLKVSLPGGYEFEANAVVKWTREQGGDAPPGFGAQFTQIAPEARQLVYRYVRNREPLFYDDF